MDTFRYGAHGARALAGAALVAIACVTPPAHAAAIDPNADRILRAMSDYLAELPRFAVITDASTEVVLKTGQKIQLTASGSGVFDRERGFRFRRQGPYADLELTFDGTHLTLYAAGPNAYRTAQVEGGNDAALDEVRHAFGIEAAGGVDLLYSNPYEGLLYEVEQGDYYGETIIGGVRAHHLAFRAAEIDWQLWVRAEGAPLPLRYVITSKWMTGAPAFAVDVREWNTGVTVAEADFTFTAPEGARTLDMPAFDALGITLTE